jgi:hypothetical protein
MKNNKTHVNNNKKYIYIYIGRKSTSKCKPQQTQRNSKKELDKENCYRKGN